MGARSVDGTVQLEIPYPPCWSSAVGGDEVVMSRLATLPVAMMMLSKGEAEAVMRASMKSKSTAGRSLASCVDLTYPYPANKEIHAVATARWRFGRRCGVERVASR